MTAGVAGLVLAAGQSTRMGSCKAAMDAGGLSFVARLVRTLAIGGCAPVLAVLGERTETLAEAVAKAGGVVVVNPGGRGGQIGSLRAGLGRLRKPTELGGGGHPSGQREAHLRESGTPSRDQAGGGPRRAHLRESGKPPAAVVFSPVDNPAVAPATVRALVAAWRRSRAAIVVPRHGSQRGHPVLADMRVAAEFFEDGLAEGARSVIRRDPGRVLEVDVPDDAVLDDLDTPEEYGRRFGMPLGAALLSS